ncbi:hypothetical protein VitviT2T_024510 [Vitis vinifera]|uniref:DUF641 domain-containing protein n=3 Tax=Vitis vinifera TaxID=29760 RepID=A0ABY9DHV9_VITVI|nr:hypothetical protein VitviT2T_024510 [Vitis vinifera]
MLPTGVKETQLRESNSQKVHPQPMEEALNQTPKALEALVSKIFMNISSLKSAYIQLLVAHTPYEPDKIQAADSFHIRRCNHHLPPHPRLPSMPAFQHQHSSQMGSSTQHNASIEPSFTQAQPPLPSQLPSQSFYQIGGSHLRTEFNNPAGSSMQVDRGFFAWMPPRHESTMGTQIPGPPPLVPGFGSSNPPPYPPMLNPEMGKALFQRVSLQTCLKT